MKGLGRVVSGAAIIVFLSCLIVFAQSTGTISLVPGWNLVSLPVQPANPAPSSVLSGIKGAYQVVWSYPNQAWQVYDPNDAAGSTLATMQAGMGYWIKMTSAKTLSLSGSAPPSSLSLLMGWNLVGYSGTCIDAPTALSSLGSVLQVSWGYPSPSKGWQFYDPTTPSGSTLANLCPGAGYWIDVSQALTWTPQGETKVSVDSGGNAQSTFSMASPDGTQLTLPAGTQIALSTAGNAVQTPTSQNNLYLSLVSGSGTLPALPNGFTLLKSFRVVLTVDGKEQDASFWSGSTGGSQQQGVQITLPVNNQNVTSGTLGLLFDVSSGKAVPVGSSSLTSVAGTGSAAATTTQSGTDSAPQTGTGSPQMNFNIDHTGSYAAGASAHSSAPAPSGAFSSSYATPDPGCIQVGSVQVCGPSKVDRAEVIEYSTAEILGMCWFGDSDTATTGEIAPGYQFWCQRSQGGSSGATITVSSMQANLPWIRAYWVRASDGLPMWETYYPPQGGLNGPGGPYSDPYQHKEFQFAGYKKLTFTTTEDVDYSYFKEYAFQPLVDAGYEASIGNFQASSPGFTGEVDVYDTLDGRVLMEENVIKKKKWKVVTDPNSTTGNRGTYQYSSGYQATTKASLSIGGENGAKVWEITGNVTFKIDKSQTTQEMQVFTPAPGSQITQTVYTVPEAIGGCTGVPASFTDTYDVAKGDGILTIKAGSDPVQYNASASISASTPVQAHAYQECCSWRNPPCQGMTLDVGAQQHMWLLTGLGGAFSTGSSSGELQGTYDCTSGQAGCGTYQWDMVPLQGSQ